MTLPPLITAEELNKLIEKTSQPFTLLAICQQPENQRRFIQGAIPINVQDILFGEKPITGLMPPIEYLTNLFQSAGIEKETPIIVYDDGDHAWACRLIWTLNVLGHNKTSLLSGGIEQALTSCPIVSTPQTSNYSQFEAEVNTQLIVDKATFLSQLNNPNLVVWDARSLAEYKGEKALAKRSGHIPGAVHLEWLHLFSQNGLLKPINELQVLLDSHQITADKSIITHCQSHRRSAVTFFVAYHLLNYPTIAAYPGSWAEWGNDLTTPIIQ